MPIFGGDAQLYDLLDRQANSSVRAVQMLQDMVAGAGSLDELAGSLKDLEAAADEAAHHVTHLADDQFIMPFDKEDIHSLTIALDDVIDMIEAAGARIVIYRLGDERRELSNLSKILVETVTATGDAVRELRHLHRNKDLSERLKRVHEAENETDITYQNALAALFAPGAHAPASMMKLKDLFDHMEIAADKCEDVAVLIEKVAVKYG